MPGPSKAPRHLKLLRGTLQPYRDTAANALLPVFDKLPAPPEWIAKIPDAAKEWDRLGPFLIVNRLLGEGSIAGFEMLCGLYAANIQAFRQGKTPSAAHITAHRTLCGSLGLLAMNLGSTPKGVSNPFEEHRSRGTGR